MKVSYRLFTLFALFALGAAWNVVIGVAMLLAPAFSLRLLYGHEPGAEDQLLIMLERDYAFCLVVFIFNYKKIKEKCNIDNLPVSAVLLIFKIFFILFLLAEFFIFKNLKMNAKLN